MKLAARLTAVVDSDGTTQSWIFAQPGHAFRTGASGTPASTAADDRLVNGGNFDRSIASGGPGARILFGLTSASYGEATIENTDGRYDALATYGVSGQLYELFGIDGSSATITAHESFPSAWTRVFVAKMTSITSDGMSLRIRLADPLEALTRPMCGRFTGAGGLEGDAELAGTPKPILFGSAYNVEPVLIEKSRLIYMTSSLGNASAHNVKDSGSVIARTLTAGAIELDAAADFDALYALSVPIGHYATCTTDGVHKHGSPVVGTVTCDASAYDSGVDKKNPADIILFVAQAANIDGFSYDSTAYTDFYTWADSVGAEVGFWARDDSTTYADALSALASSCGAWCGFRRNGEFWMARVEDPAGGASSLTIREDEVIAVRRANTGDAGRGVPYKRIVQRYPRNYTVQTSGLAGIVPAEVRKQLAEQFPLSTTTDCTQPGTVDPMTDQPIETQFAGAQDYVIESYGWGRRVTSTGDLDAQPPVPGTQFSETIGVPRETFEVDIAMTNDRVSSADIGDVVTLVHRRWGLDAGKKLLVIGYRYRGEQVPVMSLTLWG